MKPIEPPDSHFLSAAVGWMELGNPAEAKAELAQLRPGLMEHPDVLEVRWLLSASEQNWNEGLIIARLLVERAPERASGWLHLAYALRRVPSGGIQQAWSALVPAFDKFPKEPIISYNLSCYACQMNQLDLARSWLDRATGLAGKDAIRHMALCDEDLRPLWPEIRKW